MKYIIKKVFTLIITLFTVSLLAFLAFSVIPGDPTTKILGTEATPEAIAALREELGLNGSVIERYFAWLGGILRGDFGTSYIYSVPVSQLLSGKLTITFILTLMSFAITLLAAIPIGIFLGSLKNRHANALCSSLNQVAMSIPNFFIGIIIMYLCGNTLKLFIPGDFALPSENLRASMGYLVFPAISIAIPKIAMSAKMLSSSISGELGKPYVTAARSRGNSHARVLSRHILKNALLPVITFTAASAAEILTGSIIIEQVFTVPGVGRLLLSSVSSRDYPVVQAIVVIMAAWVVIVNTLADIINKLIDPRIRLK